MAHHNHSQALPRLSSPGSGTAFSWSTYLFPSVLLYVLLCSFLRYQRRDAMQRKLNYPDRASLSRMTNVDAQIIVSTLAELEFPKASEFVFLGPFLLAYVVELPSLGGPGLFCSSFSPPSRSQESHLVITGLLHRLTTTSHCNWPLLPVLHALTYALR